MYGSIAHFRPKPGKEQEAIAYLKDWEVKRGPKVAGHVGAYLYKPDRNPGDLIMAVVFKDKNSYTTNAQDPEQDRWYQGLRSLLQADPTWEDGEVIGMAGTMREAGR